MNGRLARVREIAEERQALLRDWPAPAGDERNEETRALLRAVRETDRECRALLAEKLRELEADLEKTRYALRCSRLYRSSLTGESSSRLLDERK